MKVVQINATCGIGSTGKICVGISELLTSNGIENYILCSKSNGYPLGISCANNKYTKFQALKSKILGNYGFNSKWETKKIISELERIQPDIVHLHNIHGHDCNLDMLFGYFKKKNTKLIWTFHDCWAFTGYCTYFDIVHCNKWQMECKKCPQKSEYSFFFDRSKSLFKKKRKLFEGLDLEIITPSQWLANLVKQSFLKDYPVKVINNGIDISIFKPTESNFKERYKIENKKLILGVAFDWGRRKGLDVFIELANRLPKDYQIILVGTDDEVDKLLPDNVISINRTQNQKELAAIYTASDVFVIPTREDNYPTVNMEAISCGTPVVTFNTGGSPEMVDESCGSVVDCDDIDALEREIVHICTDAYHFKDACIMMAKKFDQKQRFCEYLNLYKITISSII